MLQHVRAPAEAVWPCACLRRGLAAAAARAGPRINFMTMHSARLSMYVGTAVSMRILCIPAVMYARCSLARPQESRLRRTGLVVFALGLLKKWQRRFVSLRGLAFWCCTVQLVTSTIFCHAQT